jgi:hypothetical protein
MLESRLALYTKLPGVWCLKHVGREGWAQRVALRRGTKVGIVALARKLAGILYAMWRDGATYEKREGRVTAETVTA